MGYRERREEAARKEASDAEKRAELPRVDIRAGHTELTDDQVLILRKLKEGELQVDDLIETVGLPTRRVLSALTLLAIEGYVAESGGKRFSLTAELTE